MRASFSRVMISGLDEAGALARGAPTLWVANHTAWWDPLVAIVVSHRLGLEAHAMMAQENLERAPFFGLVGAFGVHRGQRRDGAAATRHAAALLDRPGRAVWIFPQGETRPAHEALRFHGGAASIHAHAAAGGAWFVPVGLRYALRDDPRPELWIAIGPPSRRADGPDATAWLEAQVQACLRRIDDAPSTFAPLWPVRAPGPDLATAMLSAVARWIVRRFGARLEAAVLAEPQRAIGPADLAAAEHAGERPEQGEIRQPHVEPESTAQR